MKYSETEHRATIQKEIEALLARREEVHCAWVTHKVCKGHSAGLAYQDNEQTIEPEAVAFWRFCGYAYTRKMVTDCINHLGATDACAVEDDPQPWLPGFNLIRRQYVWRRDGVDVLVPTEKATVVELHAKAAQFERNSATLAEHARELRRYAAMRAQEIAS
jgi:hypothetical protein